MHQRRLPLEPPDARRLWASAPENEREEFRRSAKVRNLKTRLKSLGFPPKLIHDAIALRFARWQGYEVVFLGIRRISLADSLEMTIKPER